MSNEDNPDIEIVAIRTAKCPKNGDLLHVVKMKANQGATEYSKEDAIYLMDAGKTLFMIPPKGSPAYPVHEATGLPLIIQTMICPHCKERILFA